MPAIAYLSLGGRKTTWGLSLPNFTFVMAREIGIGRAAKKVGILIKSSLNSSKSTYFDRKASNNVESS